MLRSLFLLLLLPQLLCGQTGSRFYRESLPGQMIVDILVQGSPEAVAAAVHREGGRVKFVTGNVSAIRIPVSALNSLASVPGVERAEIHYSPGQVLNDLMLSNNRVDSVHGGQGGLPQGYSGKNVVVGIIDSGIDPSHPDFKDSLGNTRVLAIWDQTFPFDSVRTPQPYGYGQHWSAADIDNNLCPHNDQPSYFGHGTNVSGTAAGNGSAVGNFRGVAWESPLVVVASNFNSSNWTASVADAAHYIFSLADSLGMPCVINASLGTYMGSHDGKDLAALAIDSMLGAKTGRAFVCANGNAGTQKFHLGYQVTSDTAFTWFKYNAISGLGIGAMYFQLWADTSEFNNVSFSVGADKVSGGYSFRGNIPFDNIQNRLGQVVSDTLWALSGNRIGVVQTYAELTGDSYFMEVLVAQPDSSSYDFRFMTTGSGWFDVWSASWLGTSAMVTTGLPSAGIFPDIVHYRLPDSLQQMVSSWTCSPRVLSVGNYVNRNSFTDVNGNLQTFPETPGQLSIGSSRGPTRKGLLKPDLAASGDYTLAPGRIPTVQAMAVAEPWKVAQGGLHHRTGGTSMASPVVAGMVALLFERCPDADWQYVKNSVNGSTRSDNFTGPVPNYAWGNGKADAMAMMRPTLFPAGITPGGNQVLCEGGTLTLSIPSGTSWIWNTGDTTQTISADTSSVYYAEVHDQQGCKMYSDTVIITEVPLPVVPVITVYQDMLTSSQGPAYQWYLDSNAISGAINQFHLAQQSGWYYVVVTDQNGCSSASAAVYHSMTLVFENNRDHLAVYPNPASDRLFYETAEGFAGTISIHDLRGRVLHEQPHAGESGSLSLTGIAPGYYIFTLKTPEGTICRFFSVQ